MVETLAHDPKELAPGGALEAFAALMAQVRERGGECLHLKPGSPARLRVGVELESLGGAPIGAAQTEQYAAALLGAVQRARLAADGSLEISLAAASLGRLRIRFFRQRGSLEILVRPVRQALPTLPGLGLPLALKTLAHLRCGLVVVASATGGGRSTTLAALVHHVNRYRACHILCIDDPTEFLHQPLQALVDQVEVGCDAATQEAALRAASRQDVDVIVVEDPVHEESIELLLHLAEAGRLVIASIGASSPGGAVDWLVERAPAGQRALFRQRLERQLEILLLQALLPRIDQPGQVLVSELLLRSSALAQLLLEPGTARGGLAADSSMDEQLVGLARKGIIAWEEAALHAMDKSAIERALMFD